MTPELIEYPDREMMMMALAGRLATDLGQALASSERARFCVPGGSTPVPLFDMLSATELDWSRVDVVLNDERWVEETHPRSNTALLRRHLIRGCAEHARVIPLYTGMTTPEDAAPDRSEVLAALMPISVLVLGMGADMHTASLFPGTPGLDAVLNSDDFVAGISQGVPEPRITLTPKALNSALVKHIVITGADKREAFDRALTLPADQAPIRAMMDGAVVHWAA